MLGNQMANGKRRGPCVDCLEKLMQSHKVRTGAGRPAQCHALATYPALRPAEALCPDFDLGVLVCAPRSYVVQGFERQPAPLLLQRDIGCDRLFHDPSPGPIEAFRAGKTGSRLGAPWGPLMRKTPMCF